MEESSHQALPWKILSSSKRASMIKAAKSSRAAYVPAVKKDPVCLQAGGTSVTPLQRKITEHVAQLRARDVPSRYQAAEALADLGLDAQSARTALETALLRDKSVHVRKSAARALGCLCDKAAEKVLRDVVERDEDKFVRMRAQEALHLLSGCVCI